MGGGNSLTHTFVYAPSKAGRFGSVLDFFCVPVIASEAKQSRPRTCSLDCFVVPPRNDAKREWGRSPVWNPPTPFAKGDERSPESLNFES